MANPILLPKCLWPLPKSIIDPKRKNFPITTSISSRKETGGQSFTHKNRIEKLIFNSNRSIKYEKTASESQNITLITTASPKVNSQPQEAELFVLEPPYLQSIKIIAELVLQEQKRKNNSPFKQVQKIFKKLVNPKLLPKCIRPLPKSIICPRRRFFLHQNHHIVNKTNRIAALSLQKEERRKKITFKQVQKMRLKRPANPKYYPNYYSCSRSQLLTPRSKNIFHQKFHIPSTRNRMSELCLK